MKTKIEWCDYVWNPVWGCKNNCLYCYARKMNDRFNFIENWNKLEWIQSNFNRNFPKKKKNIFVNSMSDIAFWEKNWTNRVIEKIECYPQHTFLFLTKFPKIYKFREYPKNCFLGATFTKESDFKCLDLLDFISIEPIQEKIDLDKMFYWWEKYHKVKWIIIGMETGNRKNKAKCEHEWLTKISLFCDLNRIPIFMKNNLKLIAKYPLVQEFPKELKNE